MELNETNNLNCENEIYLGFQSLFNGKHSTYLGYKIVPGLVLPPEPPKITVNEKKSVQSEIFKKFKTINYNKIAEIITNFYRSYMPYKLNDWVSYSNKYIKEKTISFLSDLTIRKEELVCIEKYQSINDFQNYLLNNSLISDKIVYFFSLYPILKT